MTKKEIWGKRAADLLVGKRIVRVAYQTPEDLDDLLWDRAALVVYLEDGTFFSDAGQRPTMLKQRPPNCLPLFVGNAATFDLL